MKKLRKVLSATLLCSLMAPGVMAADSEKMTAYLFSYFTGNAPEEEQIRFAISRDGLNYFALNNDRPIIASDTISYKAGVRDPHILRGEDGYFYMVVTDMRSSEGWASNRGLVLLRSKNLIDWTHSAIHFPTTWAKNFGNVTRVWAPQTIYDHQAGKYMVYFSILTTNPRDYDRTYYCYANEDFTKLTEPKLLYDRGRSTIDADIIYKDGVYNMFFKTEGDGNGIMIAKAKNLTDMSWVSDNKYVDQNDNAVEGSGVFQLLDGKTYVLMYDVYSRGYYEFCKSYDLQNFELMKEGYSFDFHPRHGTIITISEDELKRVTDKWGIPGNMILKGSASKAVKKANITLNHTDKVFFIPVVAGTNLKKFDPELISDASIKVTPTGPQNFTKGPITYTFTTVTGQVYTYKVTAQVENNPIVPGFRADPEILYSQKNKKYYLYPTTDGVPGWGGYSFNVYSSPDLVNWTDEGTMLNLQSEQVQWANGNAWAPCIEEKMIDGKYKYFFYFSGNAGRSKQIGVAIADDPTGPFTDYGQPIITRSPVGHGQQIDVDVFTDPQSKKSYIYWGNGYMAGAVLNDDMVSLDESTITVMTPEGGTLKDYAFREAPYVFYRNGLYYFLWSVDDTGSKNYHVAYGTSKSPLGPIEVAKEPVILIQDPSQEIYGPAHNSVLQLPGKDEWYIVYHRINAGYLNDGPGFHREVCIDRMYFDKDGRILPVKPTRKGIDPVK